MRNTVLFVSKTKPRGDLGVYLFELFKDISLRVFVQERTLLFGRARTEIYSGVTHEIEDAIGS